MIRDEGAHRAAVVWCLAGYLPTVDAPVPLPGSEVGANPVSGYNLQAVYAWELTYAPYNFTSSGVWFAPYVEAACNKVLTCPGGTLAGSQ